MKGLLACSLLALFVSGALAEEPTDDHPSESTKLVRICAQLSVVAEELIKGDYADVTNTEFDGLAFELSESLPQSYNAIYDGLISARDLSQLAITDHAAEQATVLGLWCVQDTVNVVNNTTSPYILEQETQVELINIFEQVIASVPDIP